MVKQGRNLFFLLALVTAEKTVIAQKPDSEIFPSEITTPFQSIAHTSAACGIDFLIPDNSCTAASNYQITVTNAPGSQLGTDVILEELRLIISHPWDADLDIYLSSPAGKKISLSSDNGGGADHYGDPDSPGCSIFTSFSMSACESIVDGTAPFIGSYLPEGSFNTFNDGSSPNGNWLLQICDDAPNDMGSLVFVELIFSSSICLAPTAISLVSIGNTEAELQWTSNNSGCTNTIIEYGPPGFIPGSGQTAGGGNLLSIACNTPQPYLLTNLNELSSYDLYIRESCGSGIYSGNSCVLNFTTDCGTGALTIIENFDSQAECEKTCNRYCDISGMWSNSQDDEMEWLLDKDGTSSSNTGPADDISGGGNYIYLETSGGACLENARAVLRSGCVELLAASGSCHLSFYYHMFGVNTGSLSLDITLDGGTQWINLFSASGDQGDSWYRQFIDLSAYDGNIAQFRFVATKSDGFRGDIALDQIEFYGSQLVGGDIHVYFADTDFDGYGDADSPFISCAASAPYGYSADSTDCNDSSASIHPLAAEQLCNGIDENCNGFADEYNVPTPDIQSLSVCAGEDAIFFSQTVPVGSLYWYERSSGALLAIADTFYISNVTDSQLFYAVDSLDGSCKSDTAGLQLTVLSVPSISTNAIPEICDNENFDLHTIDVEDANLTGGTLTFHSATPAAAINQLSSAVIAAAIDTTFYILSTTNYGCTDETSVSIVVKPSPTAVITPEDTSSICSNGSIILQGIEQGTGTPPLRYNWSTGSINNRILARGQQGGGTHSYALTVTDDNGCQSVAEANVLTTSSITSVAIDTIIPVSFCDGNDGQISLTPLNGQPPYNYAWEGPVDGTASNIYGRFDFANLRQGSYRVTISDSNPLNCQFIIPLIAINGPSVMIDQNILTTSASCFGAEDGAIDISVSDNATLFSWSNGATTEDIFNIPAGTYSVTVSDGNCDNIIEGIIVEEPPLLELSLFGLQEPSCNSGSDGQVNITAEGGTEPYAFYWSNNHITEDLNNISQGIYSVTVTDAQNCTSILSNIMLGEPEAMEIQLLELIAPACEGEAGGALNVQLSGGTAPYTYLWNNGTTAEDNINLTAGDYFVNVTDANGCQYSSPVYTITEPSALAIELLYKEDASCEGVDNGSISIMASGGNGGYNYSWNNDDKTPLLENLAPGIYQLTLTDSKGCEVISPDYDIQAPAVLQLDGVFQNNAACMGINDGFLDVTISGGSTPYQFEWSNHIYTEDNFNLGPGIYQLTITDANGCELMTPEFEIEIVNPLSGQIDASFDVSCYGANDGQIYSTPPQGTPPFQFLWNNGAQSEDLIQLSPGTYQATITDGEGCQYLTDSIQIHEPPALSIQLDAIEDVTCRRAADGSISVTVTGGTAPYSYNWNNGNHTEDLSGVASGAYDLIVLDANGCVITSDTYQVQELSDLDVQINRLTHVGCSGSDDGSIEITVSGGTVPYSILWSTGDTTEDLQKLNAGFYSVTINDGNGCEYVRDNLEILQIRDSIAVNILSVMGESCAGEQDGAILPGNLGGQGPYQFNWSNGVTDSINQNLAPGIYELTITDAGGCIGVSAPVEIVAAQPFDYWVDEVTDVSCFGETDGSIEITIDGGNPPYQYSWSNGMNTKDLSNLPAGTYTLDITDSRNCQWSISQPITIYQPAAPIALSSYQADPIACFGDENGNLIVNISGGTAPYSFLWNTQDTLPYLINIGAGYYQATVTDANACSYSTPVLEIEGPDALLKLDTDQQVVEDASFCRLNDGFVQIVVSGGTAPYQYLWNTGANTSSISGLSPGLYFCFITDANDCFTESQDITVGQTAEMQLQVSSTAASPQSSDGSATVLVSGGLAPYSYLWDGPSGEQTDSIAMNLSAGTYEVTVTDQNGCSKTSSVVVDMLVNTTEPVNETDITVFPNPGTGIFNFIIEPAIGDHVDIEIYNLRGQLIQGRQLNKSGSNRYSIDLRTLSPGMYLWKIQTSYEVLGGRLLLISD